MPGFTEGASVCVSEAKPLSLLGGEGCNGCLFCTEAWRSISSWPGTMDSLASENFVAPEVPPYHLVSQWLRGNTGIGCPAGSFLWGHPGWSPGHL